MVEIEVRRLVRANPPALREVAALEVAAWGFAQTEEALQKRVERLKGELERGQTELLGVFTARIDGVLAGVARVKREKRAPWAWQCFGLAVHPELRRRGVGRTLLKARIRFAKAHGADRIRSWCHRDNALSVAFHEALYGKGVPVVARDGDELYEYSMAIEGRPEASGVGS